MNRYTTFTRLALAFLVASLCLAVATRHQPYSVAVCVIGVALSAAAIISIFIAFRFRHDV